MAEHVEVLQGTIELNQHLLGENSTIRASEHEWGGSLDSVLLHGETFDVILGSDIVYEPASWPGLVSSLNRLASPETIVFIAHRKRHDDGEPCWYSLVFSHPLRG